MTAVIRLLSSHISCRFRRFYKSESHTHIQSLNVAKIKCLHGSLFYFFSHVVYGQVLAALIVAVTIVYLRDMSDFLPAM